MCAKITYDLKTTIVQLRQHGLELAPPYDDPMLMAYLLFPNRGKYELEDVVFDIFGQTLAGERTPWIQKLYEQLQPQVDEKVATSTGDRTAAGSGSRGRWSETGIAIDVAFSRKCPSEMGTSARGTDAAHLRRSPTASSISTRRGSLARFSSTS